VVTAGDTGLQKNPYKWGWPGVKKRIFAYQMKGARKIRGEKQHQKKLQKGAFEKGNFCHK